MPDHTRGSEFSADARLEAFSELREVGRGGFGVVYQARQSELDRDVAIKVLAGDALEATDMRRFQREAVALGRLSGHPNIVGVYETGVTNRGQPFIVMPFLAGGSLADRLRAGEKMSWEAVTGIGVKLAGALAAAHRADMTHRDVKPENVLFNDFGEPQLADFGIARLGDFTQTTTGHITATLAYAAPEVLDGQEATAQADVYSLGSTLFAALNGRPAFTDDNPSMSTLLARIVSHSPPDLRPAGVPDTLCSVIESAMAKSANDRPATAEQFGKRLQGVERRAGRQVTSLPVRLADGPSIEDQDPRSEETDLLSGATQTHGVPQRQFATLSDTPPTARVEAIATPRRWLTVLGAVVLLAIAGTAGRAALDATTQTNAQSDPQPTTTHEASLNDDDEAAPRTSAPSPESSPAQSTTGGAQARTPGVKAERLDRGRALFANSITAPTPYYNDMAVYVPKGQLDAPESEAALLGSWWALSDWCSDQGHGRTGVCYDLAAAYMEPLFGRDPRTINTASWQSPGAIGGVFFMTYELTAGYLQPAPNSPERDIESRPGGGVLCEPSCTAVLD